MISPHTPPGTWVVLSNPLETVEEIRKVIRPEYWHAIAVGNRPNGLRLGARFQVAQIVTSPFATCGFLVVMANWLPGQGSFLEMYSIAELPESLTGLLVTDKQPENA